jgi:formylglycine-generating enzyme
VETATNVTSAWHRVEGSQGLRTAATTNLSLVIEMSDGSRFYRVAELVVPKGMALIPAGTFAMGDPLNDDHLLDGPRVHPVSLSAFYLDHTEVSWGHYKEVRDWALQRGYDLAELGRGKADTHPVQYLTWHDMVKWCNARSEKEGLTPAYYINATKTTSTAYRAGWIDVRNDWVSWQTGYRLPTEAEWEYAARGGLAGRRFPWGDTISHNQANYSSFWSWGKPGFDYDLSTEEGYHPAFAEGDYPHTGPVGWFTPNGYGLHDMAGNVAEYCWDWMEDYGAEPQSNPHGPPEGTYRVIRGGSWFGSPEDCRVASRQWNVTGFFMAFEDDLGFRCVRPVEDLTGVVLPRITLPPDSLTRNAGQTAQFRVSATGTDPLLYRWQKGGIDLHDGGRVSGSETALLTVSQLQTEDTGDYRVRVGNEAGSVTSANAQLTVTGTLPLETDRMVLVPAGTFQMGDAFGGEESFQELPVHRVTLNALYVDRTEVTWGLWREVRDWAVEHGYDLAGVGYGESDTRPVVMIDWYDAVKWCNARSEREGRFPAYYTNTIKVAATVYRTRELDVEEGWVDWNAGYRLPTEAEWEYAARGALEGKRFPWGDTIAHQWANYWSFWPDGRPLYPYDVNTKEGYYNDNPSSTPVGSFARNGYGLYDMAGNVVELCWDYSAVFEPYPDGPRTNPHGPMSGVFRVIRDGGWTGWAAHCRVAHRGFTSPSASNGSQGFRPVLPSGE